MDFGEEGYFSYQAISARFMSSVLVAYHCCYGADANCRNIFGSTAVVWRGLVAVKRCSTEESESEEVNGWEELRYH
jgi:hypothetical protein